MADAVVVAGQDDELARLRAQLVEAERLIATLRQVETALQGDNQALRTMVESMRQEIQDLQRKMEVLHARIHLMSRHIFGRRSEQMDPGQASLFDGQVAMPGGESVSVAAEVGSQPPTGTAVQSPAQTVKGCAESKPRGPRRIKVPEHLEVVNQTIDLPESERFAPDGTPLVVVDREVSEKLDFVPGGFRKQVITKLIYGFPWKHEEVLRVSQPMPACIVPGGKATDQLLTHVFICKFAYHLPLYRQAEMAAASQVILPRSTLVHWIQATAHFLEPVYNAIKGEVLAAHVLHVDDTPVRQLDPGAGVCATARFWIYRSTDAAFFHYTENRRGEHPQGMLEDYAGYLVADAYAGFDAIFKDGTIIEIACWAHARRKFFDAHELGDLRAKLALDLIRDLYLVERDCLRRPPDERLRQRQACSQPIIDRLKALLDHWAIVVRPSEPLAKAVTYALNQWSALTRFLDVGIAPIDNNLAENGVRPIGIGRKNWLFTGSEAGGNAAAIAYTLILSARISGLEPYTYLRDTIAALHTGADPAGLTPAQLARSRTATSA